MKLKQKTIWILESDWDTQSMYEECLGMRYQVKMFDSIEEFSKCLALSPQKPFDFLIVELRLKDQSFLSFLNDPKNKQLDLSPYMVISSSEDLDVLRWCFGNGAVDFLTKPFKKNELVVKLERFLRSSLTSLELSLSEIEVDATNLAVKFQGATSQPLTLKEFQIYQAICAQTNFSATRPDIIKKVWRDVRVTEKAFDVHLVNLRRKLASVGVEIIYQAPDRYRVYIPPQEELLPNSF